ncbi:MAG: hypothetical protein Q4C66_06300 [Lachnospiraceae bacterium]|nr:hypothetical protein [Lachnospiraceae bacterium]
MLLWLLLGALIIGSIAITVSYMLTRYNLLDTVKSALNNAATDAAKHALASEFKAVIKEKKENVVKLDVLMEKSERLEVTINCNGVNADIYDGMMLKNVI